MRLLAQSATLWTGVTGVWVLAAVTPVFAIGGAALAAGAALYTQHHWSARRCLVVQVYRAGYRAGRRDARPSGD